MTSRATRACDGCRFRKVRCNGVKPCSQCQHLNLACDFTLAPTKRKPAVRGRLVAQLRDKAKSNPNQSPSGSLALAPSVTSIHGIMNPTIPESSVPKGPAPRHPSHYPKDFFINLIPDYKDVVYPVNPVYSPDEIRMAIDNMHRSYEDAALVYAFGAVTIDLSQTSWTLHGDIAAQITDLVRLSLASHRQLDIAEVATDRALSELKVTIKRALTCVWIEITQMSFKRTRRSFTMLREGISMLQIMNLSLYTADGLTDKKDICRFQRLYWEAFIHERFGTIVVGHPCIMQPLDTGLPFPDPTIPPYVEVGFNRLIRLFLIMDSTFLAHWAAQQHPNKHQTPSMPLTAHWIESKQAELDRDEADAAEASQQLRGCGGQDITELQVADLFVTRLWLRTLVWQLALSQGLLRSVPAQNTHEGLSLHFPAQRLSMQLRTLVSRLKSDASVGTHGIGILQKLFEITTTIADVLALPQGAGQSQLEANARMEDFIFLVKFLFSFERIQKEQRNYVREKVEVLRSVYTDVNFEGLAGSPF
ncbi:hypothetical protein BGZ63DRAFT_366996 [Mariannaea sp. PMI_226]|nr:hypothetical protein BGZ63DRAFT_366996 [Mariannaea sp. PMI_226]